MVVLWISKAICTVFTTVRAFIFQPTDEGFIATRPLIVLIGILQELIFLRFRKIMTVIYGWAITVEESMFFIGKRVVRFDSDPVTKSSIPRWVREVSWLCSVTVRVKCGQASMGLVYIVSMRKTEHSMCGARI